MRLDSVPQPRLNQAYWRWKKVWYYGVFDMLKGLRKNHVISAGPPFTGLDFQSFRFILCGQIWIATCTSITATAPYKQKMTPVTS